MSGRIFRRPQPEDNLSLADLETKIPHAEREQAKLRAANSIIRNSKLSDGRKIARLADECGIHPDDAQSLLRPDHSGHVGFRLLGSAASIRRMKERRQMLEHERSRPSIAFTFPGGRVEDSAEDGRVRVFLSPPRQPERAVALLARSFIFDPARQCYWRSRGAVARSVVTRVTGTSWPAGVAVVAQPVARNVAAKAAIRP